MVKRTRKALESSNDPARHPSSKERPPGPQGGFKVGNIEIKPGLLIYDNSIPNTSGHYWSVTRVDVYIRCKLFYPVNNYVGDAYPWNIDMFRYYLIYSEVLCE